MTYTETIWYGSIDNETIMTHYELMIIIPPTGTQEAATHLEELKSVIVKAGGKVDAATSCGERPLAYRIKKQKSGIYFLLTITLPKDKVVALSEALSLREDVIRSIIVVKPTAPMVALKEPAKMVAPAAETKKTTDIEL